MAGERSWRNRAPVWLRVLFGLLLFPLIWVGLALLLAALLPSALSSTTIDVLLFAEAIVAAFVSWLIVRRASTRVSAGLSTLALLACVMVALIVIPTYQGSKPSPVGGGRGPGVGQPADPEQEAKLPEFPWPPPAASASYLLPAATLRGYDTVGEVTAAILSALERNGYVERSFFRTQDGGVALVT